VEGSATCVSEEQQVQGQVARKRRMINTRQLNAAALTLAAVAGGMADAAQAGAASRVPYYQACVQPGNNEGGGYTTTHRTSNDTYVFQAQCSGTGRPYACAALNVYSSGFGIYAYTTAYRCQTAPSTTEVSITPKEVGEGSFWSPVARVCHSCQGYTFNHKQWLWGAEYTS
jgi:hypothetical protein